MAFLKQKYKPDGTPDKVNARLVAGGHMQDETLYSDTSSILKSCFLWIFLKLKSVD
jgi:hypothetical protein